MNFDDNKSYNAIFIYQIINFNYLNNKFNFISFYLSIYKNKLSIFFILDIFFEYVFSFFS